MDAHRLWSLVARYQGEDAATAAVLARHPEVRGAQQVPFIKALLGDGLPLATVVTVAKAVSTPTPASQGASTRTGGVIITLKPSALMAARLALPNSESAEELHLTLAYLGEAEGMDERTLAQLATTVARIASDTPPVAGKVSGIGQFNGEGQDVVYASFDAPALPALRERVVREVERLKGIEVDKEHGFTPHITLAYIPEGAPAPVTRVPTSRMRFGALELWIGDDHQRFPFKTTLANTSKYPSSNKNASPTQKEHGIVKRKAGLASNPRPPSNAEGRAPSARNRQKTERGKIVTYISEARRALQLASEQTYDSDDDKRLLDLYTLLVLVKGADVTLEDVHDAWAVWKHRTNRDHVSIKPFDQLTPEVQALDKPYAQAIKQAASTLPIPVSQGTFFKKPS